MYNVHAFCHLPEEVKQYGPLDCFSTFPFENYFSEIKNLIRSSHKPFQQICRKLHEILFSDVHLHKNAEISLMHFMQHTTGPLLSGLNIHKQYKKLIYKKCLFCISGYSLSDSYLLTNENKVIRIENITNSENNIFASKKIPVYNSFYNYPIESKLLNIYLLSRLSLNLEVWPIESIMAKVIILPFKDKYVCFPIIHSNI